MEASESGKPNGALLDNFYSRSRNDRVEGPYVKSYLPRGVLRAGLGITEESDAIAVVVSEETGGISICHRRRIERNFTPETFRKRIGEILLQGNYEDEEMDPEQLAREVDLPPARDNALVPHQKERSNDTLTV